MYSSKKGTISPSSYTKSNNDSYSTQWHTKGFQNIKIVSHYSKSVSHKNSKRLDFVLLQVKRMVKNRTISPSCYTKSENDFYSTQCHTKGFQNIKLVFHYSKSVSNKKFQMSSFCVGTSNTYSSKMAQSLLHATQNQKMTFIQHNAIPRASKISN